MAHEYWHAYQGQVCFQRGVSRYFGRIEHDAREFSKEYAARFMQERGLLSSESGVAGSSHRKRLLIRLESILGRHFYNPHLRHGELLVPEGGTYRRPLSVREGKKTRELYYIPEMIEDEKMKSAFYKLKHG